MIRQALPEDIASLAAIERAAGQLFPPGRVPDPDQTLPVSELAAAQAQGLLWVVEDQGQIAGFAHSELVATGELHLAELAVHPEFGQRGLGRALLRQVIQAADELDCRPVTLTTFADLPFNAPFYLSEGFHKINEQALDQRLRNILHHERANGLQQRVAMRRDARDG